MKLPISLGVAWCLSCCTAFTPAQASSLLADVISGSYAYPCISCTYTGNFSYFFNPFVVLAGPAGDSGDLTDVLAQILDAGDGGAPDSGGRCGSQLTAPPASRWCC